MLDALAGRISLTGQYRRETGETSARGEDFFASLCGLLRGVAFTPSPSCFRVASITGFVPIAIREDA